MVSVSLCMIVKNEEDVLERCLESAVDLVDEIIIVDTGSTDRTKEIAGRFTDQIYDFPWCDDFAAARNESFSHASMDYCMWLDADDVLLEGDRAAFLELKEALDPSVSVVMAPYHTGFDGSGRVTFSYYRERLVKNRAGMAWEGAVHEAVAPAGKIRYADFAVTHRKVRPSDPDRNLRIYQAQLDAGKKLEPRQQFYYGRELYYHKQYEEAISVLEAFLLTEDGWVENKIEACSVCASCYYKMGQEQTALYALLRSLGFDLPRAELCCEIGRHFLEHGNIHNAVYWYETALSRPKNECCGGFILPDCYDYVPYMQLCVCYDKLGEQEKAREYNEKAGACKPYSPAYLYNRQYFDSLQRKEQS